MTILILQAFERRMDSRRRSDVMHLLMYLSNPSYADERNKKDFFGHKIVKTSIKSFAVNLISRLFENFHKSTPDESNENDTNRPDIEPVETEEDIADPKEKTMTEQLDEFLAAGSKAANPTLDKKDISAVVSHEMNIYAQTKVLPKNGYLEVLYNALLTIPPTSVESERAFSVFGYFCNKIRSSLKTATINALIFLREYYKNM